jgi:hypothetical protein
MMEFYMNRIRTIVFLVLTLVLTGRSLFAQTTRLQTSNTNAWLMYFGNHKVSDHFGIHAEIQIRRHDVIAESQQLLLRTGIDYYTKSNARVTLGYAFIKTYPYGEFAVANPFPEHRIWQQLLVSQTLGKIKLNHRYRLEQRMIGNAATGKFENGRYENRFRYMAKATIDLTNGDHPVFIAAYDEVFLNFGKDVAYNIFDQNRLYGALGLTISPKFKMEIGYLNQMIQQRSLDLAGTPKNKIENNHTLQLGLFSNLSFIKKDQ